MGGKNTRWITFDSSMSLLAIQLDPGIWSIKINPSVQTLHLKPNFETVLIAHKSPNRPPTYVD